MSLPSPAEQPRVSPDGNYWWDGTAWQLFQRPQPSPAKTRSPATSGFLGCFGVAWAIIFVVVVVIIAQDIAHP